MAAAAQIKSKRRRRFALPAHSKKSNGFVAGFATLMNWWVREPDLRFVAFSCDFVDRSAADKISIDEITVKL